MSYHIVRPKDRDEWLEERKKGLGSSDAGTIMGASPFSSPLKIWRQKLGLEPPTPESEAMRNGHILEPAVAEFFAQVTKSTIDKTSEGDWLAVDDDRPFLRVSPDRLFWPEGVPQTPENQYILEIKSTSKLVDPNNLPLYWFCQVQYQMGVMGKDLAAVAWITSQPHLTMDYTWVKFNPPFFKTLTDKLENFWKVNIQNRVEPQPLTEDDIKALFPFSENKKVALAREEDMENIHLYNQLTQEIESLSEQLEKVTVNIKNRIADAEVLVWKDPATGDNTTVAKYKSVNETLLDVEKFREEMPDEYVKYVRKAFDKKLFKDEDPNLFKKYATTQKGSSRRFSVTIS